VCVNERLAGRVVEVVNKTLNPKIREALSHGGVIDITTQGRRTGNARRIEIVFHDIEGRTYISGMPSHPRGWLANLVANPSFTFHLKGAVKADLPATARVITDEAERRQILEHVARTWKRKDLDVMVETSPLIEVSLDGIGDLVAAP
jgi:deazaflavin-dependent oxidoreductase (nitroreductase family)